MDERWIPAPVFTGTGYARWMGEVGMDSRPRLHEGRLSAGITEGVGEGRFANRPYGLLARWA